MLIIDTMMNNKLTQFCYNDYIEFYKVKIIGINADATDINYEFVDFIRNLNNYQKNIGMHSDKLINGQKTKHYCKNYIFIFFHLYKLLLDAWLNHNPLYAH